MSWDEPIFKKGWNEAYSIAFDPTVDFLPSRLPDLVGDNIVEWDYHVYNTIVNRKSIQPGI